LSPKGTPGLEVVSGPASGKRLTLGEDPLEIGREGGEDGRLGDDPELSRHHARVSIFKDGGLLVEDLGSTNGTFVNGEQIGAPTVLGVGDTVSVGDSELRVTPAAAAVYGGVHTVPTDLLSVLVARAPVRKEWVVKAFWTAFPIVLVVNLTIRTIAVEFLGVSSHDPTMRLPILFVISLAPTLADSIIFYKSFGRPSDESVVKYVAGALSGTLTFATLECILLPSSAELIDYVITVTVAIVPPSVILPTMVALRVRAGLTADRGLRGAEA
jgi:pSer/pThr/pTyr-binding forkhead associated (FHA) protein